MRYLLKKADLLVPAEQLAPEAEIPAGEQENAAE